MRSKISVATAILLFSSVAFPQLAHASTLTSSSTKYNVQSVSASGKEKLLGYGTDGIARTVITENNGKGGAGVLSNKLNLQPGDRVKILKGGEVAQIYDASGTRLGEFVSPTVQVNGSEIQGKFAYKSGNLETTFGDHAIIPYGCWQGTAAKWTWRVSAGLICGATGVISVPGGFACGLGAAGAEDAMNIDDHACK